MSIRGIVVKKDLWPVIRAQVSLANGSFAAVGFPSGESRTDEIHSVGMSNVDVALANELGSAPGIRPMVPPRPFMAQTFRKQKSALLSAQHSLMHMILDAKMSTKIALERLGRQGQSEVQKEMASGDFAANAHFTVIKKGSDVPLMDTGALRQAVTWKVFMRSGRGMGKKT